MKKFLSAFLLIFIVNLGCKKMDVGGGGLCACSVLPEPVVSLIIKDNTNADLLNSATTGYFDKSKIQFYYKDANNVVKQLNFGISQPFTYTNDVKVTYYQLVSYEIGMLAKTIDTFYLKLGDSMVYEVKLKVNNTVIEKLLINNVELSKEYPSITTSPIKNIYTFKI